MNVTADFLNDVREQLLAELDNAGFDTKKLKGASASDVAFTYFNLRVRLPDKAARRVHRSRTLLDRKLDADIETALGALTKASEAGASLGPFLHKKLTSNPGYN